MKAIYQNPTTKLYRVGNSASTSRGSKKKHETIHPVATVTGVAPGSQPDLQNRYESRRVPIEPPWGNRYDNLFCNIIAPANRVTNNQRSSIETVPVTDEK